MTMFFETSCTVGVPKHRSGFFDEENTPKLELNDRLSATADRTRGGRRMVRSTSPAYHRFSTSFANSFLAHHNVRFWGQIFLDAFVAVFEPGAF